ncbi:MAG: hypothetical protein JWQ63_3840 [Mucilaginibacter sp.]|nr:hypothetical protein [Mucilaginibacter sp.]
MKIGVFTIVAKNYFGLAEVLGASVKKTNPDVDFNIFIADEIEDNSIQQRIDQSAFRSYICKDVLNLDSERWYNNAFKYNITEFCTYLKPHCFKFLFNSYDQIIYFDPDIYLFNSLDNILHELEENFMVITPHITTLETEYTGDSSQLDILGSGIYNLGFLALKKCENCLRFIDWWANRLENFCFADKFDNLFTDQKWMDFIFSFFDEGIKVSRDLGRNMAPWNFYERKIIQTDDGIYVYNRITHAEKSKLTFVHFSGFNYKNLNDSNSNLPRLDINNYPDIKYLFDFYESQLGEGHISDYLSLSYSYNFFENKIEILHLHRRFYRRILSDENLNVRNPFLTAAPDSYYKQLLDKKLVDKNVVKNEIDKLSKESYDNYYKKTYYINKLFYIAKMLLGFKRYFILSRFFVKYFKTENQFFLFNNKDVIKPN